MTESERRELMAMLERAAAALSEHFDSVQILATTMNSGRTLGFQFGCGNYYARLALAREFIEEDSAKTSAGEIAEKLSGEDEND